MFIRDHCNEYNIMSIKCDLYRENLESILLEMAMVFEGKSKQDFQTGFYIGFLVISVTLCFFLNT